MKLIALYLILILEHFFFQMEFNYATIGVGNIELYSVLSFFFFCLAESEVNCTNFVNVI